MLLTSATNAACALEKQITSGLWGKFILKQNMTRILILISLKFRLVHTTVVIAITLPSANMICESHVMKKHSDVQLSFRVMSGV